MKTRSPTDRLRSPAARCARLRRLRPRSPTSDRGPMSRCGPSLGLACAALLALAACAHERDPTPAEYRPLEDARAPRQPLPDDAERIAARLAAAVLDGQRESAEAWAAELAQEDAR